MPKTATRKSAKKAKTAKLRNIIAIILDESGSMDAMRKEAVDAFNSQVKAIREGSKKMETTVSLVTFSTTANTPLIWNKDVAELKDLKEPNYRPNGMTALFDAVGRTITDMEKLPHVDDKNTSMLVVIISDGQENQSKEYTSATLAAKIKALQATKRWTFTYLGANQDLAEVSLHLGIPFANTQSWVSTKSGLRDATLHNSASTAHYMYARSAGMTSSDSFYVGDTATSTGKKKEKK